MSVSKPFDEALRLERESFMSLMNTPESRALRHVFAAERAATKIADVPEDIALRPIRKVGIIGAGTMGGGIAMNFANAGIAVALLEMKQEALDKGLATIRENYDNTAKKGRSPRRRSSERMALIEPTLGYDALADVDLVIEAVFEDMDVKKAGVQQLDEVCKPGAILASNTSYLDIDTIAGVHPAPAGRGRPALLQPGQRDAAAGDRARRQDRARRARHLPGAGQDDQEGRRRRRRVRRLHRQPHAGRYAAAADRPADAGRAAAAGRHGAARTSASRWGRSGSATWRAWTSAGPAASARPPRTRAPASVVVADTLCEHGRFGQKTGARLVPLRGRKARSDRRPAGGRVIEQFRTERGIDPAQDQRRRGGRALRFALVNEGAAHPRREASPPAPATSTWSTSTATASRSTAAARCCTPTSSACPTWCAR